MRAVVVVVDGVGRRGRDGCSGQVTAGALILFTEVLVVAVMGLCAIH